MTDQPHPPASCPASALDVLGHDYDHYDPEFALDPHDTYAQLRAGCPVAHTDNYGGFYVMTKYADVSTVLHDAKTFSSWPADTPPTPGHTRALIPLEVDAPDHRRYRMIVDPLFRPNAIAHIEASVRDYAVELVDGMLAKREFDFMKEFADPYPSSVFLRLVGMDSSSEMRDQLCDWASTILHTTTKGAAPGDVAAQTAARMEAGKSLHNWLKDLLAERHARPGNDILSVLIEAELPGQRKMDDKEILNFAYVMVLAGLDTVTTAIGFSFLHLAQRPDLQDRLRDDPSLIPSTIDEMLRYEAIVHASRTVMERTVIRGVELLPGDRVVVPLASAHRDEEKYENAHEIVLDRAVESSMVFGAGSHRCVGQHLARMELTIAFEEILRRIPEFSLQEDPELIAYGGQTRSLSNLPFRTFR